MVKKGFVLRWIIILIILIIATIMDIFIPDPLPFIDEIILIALTIIAGIRLIMGSI